MPKYALLDADGHVVNTVICAPTDIAVFVPKGGSFVMRSQLDKPLADLRQQAHARLTDALTVARRTLVTDLPGQEMIYLRKEDEAKRIVAASGRQATITPDPVVYPILSAEVGVTAPTLYEVAQVILWKSAMWQRIAAALEAYRHRATAQIEDADETQIERLLAIDHTAEVGITFARV